MSLQLWWEWGKVGLILLVVILPAGLIPECVNVLPEIQETLTKAWSNRITQKGGALVRMIVIRLHWGNDPWVPLLWKCSEICICLQPTPLIHMVPLLQLEPTLPQWKFLFKAMLTHNLNAKQNEKTEHKTSLLYFALSFLAWHTRVLSWLTSKTLLRRHIN